MGNYERTTPKVYYETHRSRLRAHYVKICTRTFACPCKCGTYLLRNIVVYSILRHPAITEHRYRGDHMDFFSIPSFFSLYTYASVGWISWLGEETNNDKENWLKMIIENVWLLVKLASSLDFHRAKISTWKYVRRIKTFTACSTSKRTDRHARTSMKLLCNLESRLSLGIGRRRGILTVLTFSRKKNHAITRHLSRR